MFPMSSPAFFDTKMVTSWPLKYIKLSTLLAAVRCAWSLAISDTDTRSSNRVVSAGGMRLVSSVIL